MGLVRKLGKLVVPLVLAGGVLHPHIDFSNVTSEKHQKVPITRRVEERKGEKYAILVSADGRIDLKKT